MSGSANITGAPARGDAILATHSLSREMHPELQIATGLFSDGHFDEAVRKAAQRFMNRVQEMVDRPDLDGVVLMNTVFSEQKPLLAFNERETLIERDEHNGFRFLAVGLAQAVRNVVTHSDAYGFDYVTAREWLMFISAMQRRLDEAEQVAPDSASESTEASDGDHA